jgi:hypothetical protein
MSRFVLLAGVFAATISVAGCGGGGGLDLARLRTAVRASATELSWRSRVVRLNPEHPAVSERVLAPMRARLERAVTAGGAKVVRLSFEWINGPAPNLVIATTEPAKYLKHGLPQVVRALRRAQALYIAVVDHTGARVLEWSHAGNEGSVYVQQSLERCSPVVAIGWPSNLTPCPSK